MVDGSPDAAALYEDRRHVDRATSSRRAARARIRRNGRPAVGRGQSRRGHSAWRSYGTIWERIIASHSSARIRSAGFDDASDVQPFNGICACHSRVIPAESYAAIDTADRPPSDNQPVAAKSAVAGSRDRASPGSRKALSKRERELADFFENATEGLHKVGPTERSCGQTGPNIACSATRPTNTSANRSPNFTPTPTSSPTS